MVGMAAARQGIGEGSAGAGGGARCARRGGGDRRLPSGRRSSCSTRTARRLGQQGRSIAFFDSDPDGMIGRPLYATPARPLDTPSLRAMVDRVAGTREMVDAGTREMVEGCELTVELPDGGARIFAATASGVEAGRNSEYSRRIAGSSANSAAAKRALIEAEEASGSANLAKSRLPHRRGPRPAPAAADPEPAARNPAQHLADKEALAALATAERTCETMKSIVRMMLDLDQLERGAVRRASASFPVRDFRQPRRRVRRARRGQGPRLAARRFRPLHPQRPVLLENMLRNFLSNAVRYTDRGCILLGGRRRGDRLRIEVWDTGIGIPAAQVRGYSRSTSVRPRPRTPRGGLPRPCHRGKVSRPARHTIDVRSARRQSSVFAIEVPLVARTPAHPHGRRRSGAARSPASWPTCW